MDSIASVLPIGVFTSLSVILLAIYFDLRRQGRFSTFAHIGRTAINQASQVNLTQQVAVTLMPVVLAAFPEDTRAMTERKMAWAGIDNMDALEFLALKLAAALLSFAGGGVISLLTGTPFLWFIFLGAAGYLGPDYWLQGRITRRQKEISRDMLEFSTLLATVIRAGGDVYGALQQVGRQFSGALGEEVIRTAHEMASGSRRADALLKMAERCGVDELTQLVQVIIQADRYGTPIAEAISEHAAQMRVLRRYAAEKQAGEAVVKMTFPLLMFIVGPLLFMLIYPAMMQFGKILK